MPSSTPAPAPPGGGVPKPSLAALSLTGDCGGGEATGASELPAVGARVRCEGLTGAAELNGRLGRVVSHEGERARVRMDGRGGHRGRAVGVKPQNLVVVVGLLDLLKAQPELFHREVLGRLDPSDRTSLTRAASALRDMVYPRSIFPSGLPRAGTTATAGAARVFKLADFVGSVERLGWAKANGCPWEERTCELAAGGGHLVALQWARAQGCLWDAWTSYSTAEYGHLEVLQWAREHDCPWDEDTCNFAAVGGRLALLQWARQHGCPWSKEDCAVAARNHPETLTWVRQQPE
jgi:hypothetical protein